MTIIFKAVLVMLATVVSTLVESTDLPPVPEDSTNTAKLEGSEPLPLPPEHYGLEPTPILPHERAYGQRRKDCKDIRYVTQTKYILPKTVTTTVIISPTEVPAERPNQTPDYCNSNGMFLYEPTNECFKYLNDRFRSFKDADAQCRKEGMILAKPKNPKAIQKHLVTVLGFSGHIYIGARGDGQSFKWQRNGGAISNTDPNWWTGMPAYFITTDRCLVLVAQQNGVNQGKVYYPEPCSGKLNALCQREECFPRCAMGTCTGPNTCAFDPRSEENQNMIGAETAVCPDGCGNGTCTAQCTCSDGYKGNTCDKKYTCNESEGFFKVSESEQCFKFFPDSRMTWADAKNLCEQNGLLLAKPKDEATAVALRNYIFEKYANGGTKLAWLGAKGTGSIVAWDRDGTTLPCSSSAWYLHTCEWTATNNCLQLLVQGRELRSHPSNPYYMATCPESNTHPLCELIMY